MDKDRPIEKAYVQGNGSLYYPASRRKFYGNDRYCVDEANGLTIYLCYTPEDPKTLFTRMLYCIDSASLRPETATIHPKKLYFRNLQQK
ncbi:hypothetical protein NQ317_013597 [Molorchus minor]|uniref:Uncharacterized protein n=1 Tax=Molorchus minor TaxID=1323400 RepID=A0ABQ9J8L9_9CUCU|nr:hypothetical protein NQ317_013597 [Molorchus minor]